MAIMANYWASLGWRIHLLSLDNDATPFYPIHSDVVFKSLDLSQPLGGAPVALFRLHKRIHELRMAVCQTRPEVILSFNDITNILVLLAVRSLGVPVIVSERNDPHCHPLKNPWRLLRGVTYRRANSVVAQTQSALTYFSSDIRQRGRVIPNPVLMPDPLPNSGRSEGRERLRKVVLAMGRLEKQKGFDNLIQAFGKLAARHSGWDLVIWGDGQERNALENRIRDLGLQNRVLLPGTTKKPGEIMRNADLFVLSSYYEGFPNVLGEAMAHGLPVLSYNCPSGPSELIRDGIDGILVPPGNMEALGVGMDRLMSNEAERQKLSASAPQVVERFGLKAIMEAWTHLIEELRRTHRSM
jgi:GalNAc-alpha-(1->4)-GalNAc-alpha-(1->3)-diNAcBac-PP-undecaprenol alpha-1,4-N-acetyl-D-galactosaminyltransferase